MESVKHTSTATLAQGKAPDVEVAIIGTGFAGLGMAIRLKQSGQTSFVLLERESEVGGTWRDNHYPGAACDVPSHLYSFSFAPNPDWSRKYPTQPELYDYLRRVANDHGLYPFIRFNETLESARFDEESGLWEVKSTGGVLTARSVVMASGGLAEPKLPDIPGVENFQGKTFHSARWDHDYDLAGKRVAVIGSGASAIQLVPEIARQAGQLDVYQRTPNWIIPRQDRAYLGAEKQLFRKLPLARQLHRAAIYWGHESRVMGLVLNPKLMTVFQKLAEWHIRRQVKDATLRERVTPDYTIGCRRILISNDWYPALQQPNVELVTEGIREIRANSIVTADGQEREIDVLVFATGFYATENPIAEVVSGRNGETLAHAWRDGEEAYLGTLVNGFPNLFFIIGPNTGLGHTSMIFMIESQVEYIARLLALRERRGAGLIEVRPEVQQRYNDRLQKRLGNSIWATGCDSWYKHRNGKITALWPGFTFEFRLRTSRFNPGDYQLG
ncbi:flavin-containing monooxygenase [Alcanivorax quisquiliarum]|uniref:NAD(P)/FAD-dependent oxidoreductase n=1 Tax=Alcanivorax quisquiliarum TaxID=2933565 RepID=A0ABT0E977_9GAMM|nr:NAD(P)/FAD-dependent oxidoreductase [Alcanivorax quisquiliarum]MCK0538389.1 NAD(P)/FAD-dependent oxidoreductase [Alcanivorax quisquiliarum]